MTTIYLINNSFTINDLIFLENEPLKVKREKRILSIEGEEESKKLINNPLFSCVNKIYASPYVMSIATAKYLARHLELNINVTSALGERVVGELGNKKISFIIENQENDFDFCLSGGESLNDVKKRMLNFINLIIEQDKNLNIALFTHNVAITCLLSNWCKKGFNLDNRLILNFNDEAVIDGTWSGINIIKLEFEDNNLLNIKRER